MLNYGSCYKKMVSPNPHNGMKKCHRPATKCGWSYGIYFLVPPEEFWRMSVSFNFIKPLLNRWIKLKETFTRPDVCTIKSFWIRHHHCWNRKQIFSSMFQKHWLQDTGRQMVTGQEGKPRKKRFLIVRASSDIILEDICSQYTRWVSTNQQITFFKM